MSQSPVITENRIQSVPRAAPAASCWDRPGAADGARLSARVARCACVAYPPPGRSGSALPSRRPGSPRSEGFPWPEPADGPEDPPPAAQRSITPRQRPWRNAAAAARGTFTRAPGCPLSGHAGPGLGSASLCTLTHSVRLETGQLHSTSAEPRGTIEEIAIGGRSHAPHASIEW